MTIICGETPTLTTEMHPGTFKIFNISSYTQLAEPKQRPNELLCDKPVFEMILGTTHYTKRKIINAPVHVFVRNYT